jgi:hypothetical protein
MKTIHSRYAINTTHTQRWHVVKLFWLVCMCLGFTRLAYAQQIGIDAPNSIHTNQFASVSLTTDCTVQSVTWQLDGGTIINSYNNNTVIEVKWTTAGYKYISASLIQVCNGQAQTAATQPTAIQVTQAPIPPVTISGRVANPCGIGINGVVLQGFPTSVTTNNEGYYTTTVPFGWSGSVSAVKSPIQFTPSQPVVNTNADRTLNFSVVGGALEFASLTATWGYNPAVGDVVTIGGLVPGYSYTYSYFHKPNGQWIDVDVDQATASTMIVQINRNDNNPFCIRRKCGNLTQVCAY